MSHDFKSGNYSIKTDKRTVDISQALLYVIEINKDLETATGVDLVSAATTGVDSAGAIKVTRSLGIKGRAYVKEVKGKHYLILKGNPGRRPVLTGTRYLSSNPLIAHITVGARALAASAVRMTSIAVVAYTALRVVESVFRDEDTRFVDLLGQIGSDIIKFSIAATAGFIAGAVFGAVSTLAAGPLIAAIFVGIGTSIILSRIDNEFGLSERLARHLEKAMIKAKEPFNSVARQSLQWERNFINQAVNYATQYQ